jgi:phage portal protein BeeE
MVMSFMDRLFKAQPQRRPSDAPTPPLLVNVPNAKAGLVNYSVVAAAEQGRKHPFVFPCIRMLVEAGAQVPWYCEPDPLVAESEQAPQKVIDELNSLLASPSDSKSPFELKQWMIEDLALYGRIAMKIGLSVSNTPNGIYPLTTRHVTLELDARGNPKTYGYGYSKNKDLIPAKKYAAKGTAYVCEVRKANSDGSCEWQGTLTPLSSLGLPTEITKLLLHRAYDTASGHANIQNILQVDPVDATPKAVDDLMDELENYMVSGEDSGGMKFSSRIKGVLKVENNLSDIHSKVPMDDMARMIARAFGIPIALYGLGAADAAKFAGNYAESIAALYKGTVIPGYLVPIEEALTLSLCPYGARIRFNRDAIEALALERLNSSAGFITVDEARELRGWTPLGGEQGSQLWKGRVATVGKASDA